MSGNTAISYAVGAVLGVVVGVATAGIGLAAYATLAGTVAFGAGALATNYLLSDGATSAGVLGSSQSLDSGTSGTTEDAAAAELDIASSSEAVVAPVVFGLCRLSGNYLRYDTSTFRADPIVEKYAVAQNNTVVVDNSSSSSSSGGKGGADESSESSEQSSGSKAEETETVYAEQITGYNYYLSWEYGLCMGPVDAIGRVWDATDESEMTDGTSYYFGDYDDMDYYLNNGETGGSVRIYRGSATQVRVPGEIYSEPGTFYRHVCFAVFRDFWMGQSAAPHTYQFEIFRLPKCFLASGEHSGIYNRGSYDGAHPCFYDANPVACLYEILTNPVWGRGLHSDLIDVASFVSVANYLATQSIGMSFVLDSATDLTSVVDNIRSHVNTVVVWTGQKLKCVCMLHNYEGIKATIWEDQVVEPEFSRPAWPDMVNELRVEFCERDSLYDSALATIQDNAAIEVAGCINPKKLTLSGFSNRTTAEAMASRLLQEMSYPQASLSFKMNRWDSHLECGDLFRFVWNEWSAGYTVTFWRISEISDDEQSSDGIRITAVEDIYSQAYEGAPETYTPVVPPFESDTFLGREDLYSGEDHNKPLTVDEAAPVRAWEMNAFLSGGDPDLIVTVRQPNGYVKGFTHRWSLDGANAFTLLGATAGFAVPGALGVAGLPASARTILRFAGDAFTISLDYADADEGIVLGSANKVILPTDHIQTLTQYGTDLLLVGKEIILCGSITETSPGVYTVKNYMRAAYGSAMESHAGGAAIAFIPAWSRVKYALTMGAMPRDTALDMISRAATPSGEDTTDIPWTPTEGDKFVGRGQRPFLPGFLSKSVVGLNYSVTVRPRFHANGAMVKANFYDDFQNLTLEIPPGYTFRAMPYNGSTALLDDPTPMSATFTPDDGVTSAAGRLVLDYTAPASTTKLRIYSALNGRLSETYLEITP